MKTLLYSSFAYALSAMASGVFYRIFTTLNDFSGRTILAFVHTHLFLLGMVMLLLATLFAIQLPLCADRRWRWFLCSYHAGVVLTSAMLLVRGILQVRMVVVTPSLNSALSGVAGLGHLFTAVGLVLFFLCLHRAVNRVETSASIPSH